MPRSFLFHFFGLKEKLAVALQEPSLPFTSHPLLSRLTLRFWRITDKLEMARGREIIRRRGTLEWAGDEANSPESTENEKRAPS